METAASATRGTLAIRSGDWRALAGLFLLAFLVRMLVAALLPFPSLDDPAFYYKVAENLSQGRGLVIEVIWSHLVSFDTVLHPSSEHWMPLTSLILAAAFLITGPSFFVAQTTGAVFGALVAPLTWLVARDALTLEEGWRWRALFAGAVAAINPLLVYQAVTVDSAVYFTLLGGACLWLAGRAPRGESPHWATGALAGLAYLARSEGLVLLGLLLVRAWKDGDPSYRLRRIGLLGGTAGLVVVPWLLRNAMTFGAPFPVPTLALALLPDYPTLFHYGQPSYWESLSPPQWGQLALLRIEGLFHNLFVLVGRALFPWSFLLPLGLLHFGGRGVLGTALAGAMLLFSASALLFPVLTLWGAFYHSVGATLPGLTVLGLLGAERFGRNVGARFFQDPLFLSLLAVSTAFALTMAQLALFAGFASELHRSWQEEFTSATAWLQERGSGTVVTTQPHSLHYASGLPAVMLPASDPPQVVAEVARRYGARYLVGFGRFGRYPEALEASDSAGFVAVYIAGDVWIYELVE